VKLRLVSATVHVSKRPGGVRFPLPPIPHPLLPSAATQQDGDASPEEDGMVIEDVT
jgi:hypothetical protein